MLERLVLAMYVGEEVLGWLWQVQNCLKVDDFSRHA